MGDCRRIFQHTGIHTQHGAGDDIDETESNDCGKGASCFLLRPGTADGGSKQDVQVSDDRPADLGHGIARHEAEAFREAHRQNVAETDHQACGGHDRDHGHEGFAELLQEVKVDGELLFGGGCCRSCLACRLCVRGVRFLRCSIRGGCRIRADLRRHDLFSVADLSCLYREASFLRPACHQHRRHRVDAL